MYVELPPIRGLHRPLSVDTQDNDELKEACFTDFERFVREFFPHHTGKPFSQMHRDFFNIERQPVRRGSLEVVAAPRGNAKTTFRVLLKALHAIAYGYHPFIIIIGFSQAEASDKVKDIRDELLENERFIQVYGQLINKGAGQTDFTTTNGVRVTARSRGGQIRGLKFRNHRPSLVLLDDIESLETVNTPEQRAKTKAWFTKDVMGAGSADQETSYTIVGTVLHQESLLAELLEKKPWQATKYQAIRSWSSREDLWKEWESIYTDLSNPDSSEAAQAFYDQHQAEMLQGVDVLWPDGESYLQLQQFKVKFGVAALMSEKQNEPYDPTMQVLRPDECERFTVIWPGQSGWNEQRRDGFVIQGSNFQVHSSALQIVAFHDPALAKTNNSDYAAIVVCGQDTDGYIYVLDAWLRREPVGRQIQKGIDLCQTWGVDTLYVEAVAFQGVLSLLYEEEMKLRDCRIRVHGVNQHTDKVGRINQLEPYFGNRWIRLADNLDRVFLDQIRLFPTTHDDGPDALHGCVTRLRRPGARYQTIQEGYTLS